MEIQRDRHPSDEDGQATWNQDSCCLLRSRYQGYLHIFAFSSVEKMYAALHVLMADEAVCIGPPASKESYLCIDKIIKAMKDTGAQAV